MKTINEYQSALRNLCEEFGNKYFEESDWDIIGNINVWYWPIEVADYFFSIDNIACAISNNIPKEVLLKWYDYTLEEYERKWITQMNLYSYYLFGK